MWKVEAGFWGEHFGGCKGGSVDDARRGLLALVAINGR
jgi:hypothetical protein